jgi:glycosyltransferase involved in cell wall biosynthesis
MNPPLVSIICPFYNSERFLSEAIESVLGQDFRDFELLLVDDGSVDGSTEIALHYSNRHVGRVRYLQHHGHANRGAAPSRNLGIEASSSGFIAFIDSDDVWRPGKLSGQLAIFEQQPDVGMVCGAVNYWRSWEGGPDKVMVSGRGISQPPETALRLYPLGPAVAPCPSDILLRRSALDEIGGFEPDFAPPFELYEDQAFLIKAYLTTPVYFAPSVWLDYRLHDQSCVARLTRQGVEPEMRRYFLEWLTNYLAAKDFAGRTRVLAAVARAHWEVDHPVLGSLLRRGRRLFARTFPPPAGLNRQGLISAG